MDGSKSSIISIHALLAESDHYDNYNLHCVEISIHALLAESDHPKMSDHPHNTNFYPRSPCGERPHDSYVVMEATKIISIHALLAESDFDHGIALIPHQQFLSTLSLRRATAVCNQLLFDTLISIHALLAESDRLKMLSRQCPSRISIHALLAESDRQTRNCSRLSQPFLSTLSLRRATRSAGPLQAGYTISIHALLAESDHTRQCCAVGPVTFLSTLSLRRATGILGWWLWDRQQFLSTLSLRRATVVIGAFVGYKLYFYPRSPCGERPQDLIAKELALAFLSTLSLRRATAAGGAGSEC